MKLNLVYFLRSKMNYIIEFLLHWSISWCQFIEGLIGILTGGLYSPDLSLWAARKYAKYMYTKGK
jgi:hypothetical protein